MKITRDRLTNFLQKSKELDFLLKKEIKDTKEINQLKHFLFNEFNRIFKAIEHIQKWEYRRLLKQRYLNKMKWSELIEYFFVNEPDYFDEKDYKYKSKIMNWHRAALKELEKIEC